MEQAGNEPFIIRRSTLAEVMALFKLEGDALPDSDLVDDRIMLCAWCEPTLASVSHGCCAEHAQMIRNS